MYKLTPTYQQYHWGKKGNESEVAQIMNKNSNLIIDESSHYAELWMGAHIKSPSTFSINGKPADKSLYDLSPKLPYLLKVLSVDTALSIQSHPNKTHAEKLFSERPDVYKDPNHKPEMCIALTKFEGLCGFRKLNEINNFLQNIPELSNICKFKKLENTNDLKIAFSNLMRSDKEIISSSLETTVNNTVSINNNDLLGDLLHRLNKQYPGDVGMYCIYFLNRVILNEGECMFLSANVPHAYLDGNCVECMACSDNVVRAGLTPKYRDVDTLIDMLDYIPSSPVERKFEPENINQNGLTLDTYTTPIKDFLVRKITLNKNDDSNILENVDSDAIYLCSKGSCKVSFNGKDDSIYNGFDMCNEISRGSVCFTPSNFGDVKIEEVSDDLVLWRATKNF